MSTKRFESIIDFVRHGADIEIECGCGHVAKLPCWQVNERFREKRWPRTLGAAAKHFTCSRCGRHPVRIGPVPR